MASWTNGYWSQNDDQCYGLPYTNTSGMIAHEPDFHTGYTFYWYYPQASGYMPLPKSDTWVNEPDISWVKMIFGNNAQCYGLPVCLYPPVPLNNGSFKNCTNLTTIKIPPSVTFIDYYTFTGSSLTSVQLAPDCRFYENTFPPGCTVSYYPATIDRIEVYGVPQNSITFVVDDNPLAILMHPECSVYIKVTGDGKTVERPLRDFVVSNVDTSQEATEQTGTISFKSCDGSVTVSKNFTYDVVALSSLMMSVPEETE